MEEKEVIVERQDRFCVVAINRIKKRNTLSRAVYDELTASFERLSADPDIRAVVLTGAGKEAFCAGYDVDAIPTNVSGEEALRGMAIHEKCLDAIASYPYPVIGMINGYTFGGGLELAAICDIRVASEKALFGMPAARLGMVYSSKGIRNFINALGFANTKEIFFTARRFDARRAKEIGLVHHVVADEDLRSFALTMAKDISGNAPLTLKAAKFSISKFMANAQLTKEDEEKILALRLEGIQSEDLKEGQRAFKEKRDPVFVGR